MELIQAETNKKASLPVLNPSATQMANAAEVLILFIDRPSLRESLMSFPVNLPGKIGQAVRYAHTKQGVTQLEFYNNLKIKSPDEHGKLQFICTKTPDSKDTYNSVDVQGWLKYLYYGGQRRIGTGYAEDQDKVMRFFGITPVYNPKQQDPHRLWCDYGYHLQMAIKCRNNLSGHQVGNTYSNMTFFDLMRYYYGVMGAFLPFAETVWEDQQSWKDLLADVKKRFFKALGKVSYDRSAFLNLTGIPSDRNNRNLAENLLRDTAAVFKDGSITCTNTHVSFYGDVGDFASDLEVAWNIAANQRLSDGVEHMVRCLCHRYWSLEIFDLSCEGLRRMPLTILNKLDDTGTAGAMLELGERYWNGIEGAERDGNQAVSWYKKAANIASSTAEASYRLGLCFQSGCDEFEPNLSEAQSWMDSAARLKHAAAQVWVGTQCEKEKPDVAFRWFQEASNQGYADGHYHTGRCYENGIGTECDITTAISKYRAAINAGHKKARYNLALCLPRVGPWVLNSEAETLLQELVKEGHSLAMCALASNHLRLAELIVNGEATGDAMAEQECAKKLLLQAAEGGHAPAWVQLGAFYAPYDAQRNAYGHNWEKSMECYRKAAAGGDPEGYYQLGWACCCIHGFNKMPTEEALGYFRTAADLGHAEALYILGLYVLERDVQNDGEEPFFYMLSEAGRLGHKWAAQMAEIFTIRHPSDEPPQREHLIEELQRQIGFDDNCDIGINFAAQQYALAHCYFQRALAQSQTSDDDIHQAMYWLKEAAKSGSRVAKRELYEFTCKDDPAAAMNWLRCAAEQGSCEAMRMMYLATCECDSQGAIEWLRKAAAAGSVSSNIALHYLEQGKTVRFDLDPVDMYAEISNEEWVLLEDLTD